MSDGGLTLKLTLYGKCQSGKNRVLITRTGHRYPPKRFAAWRDDMVGHIRDQMPNSLKWNNEPCFGVPTRLLLTVAYTPGDRIKRDVPGMLDALCHILERAGVVEDDAQIKQVHWTEMPLDRTHPRLDVTVEAKP